MIRLCLARSRSHSRSASWRGNFSTHQLSRTKMKTSLCNGQSNVTYRTRWSRLRQLIQFFGEGSVVLSLPLVMLLHSSDACTQQLVDQHRLVKLVSSRKLQRSILQETVFGSRVRSPFCFPRQQGCLQKKLPTSSFVHERLTKKHTLNHNEQMAKQLCDEDMLSGKKKTLCNPLTKFGFRMNDNLVTRDRRDLHARMQTGRMWRVQRQQKTTDFNQGRHLCSVACTTCCAQRSFRLRIDVNRTSVSQWSLLAVDGKPASKRNQTQPAPTVKRLRLRPSTGAVRMPPPHQMCQVSLGFQFERTVVGAVASDF